MRLMTVGELPARPAPSDVHRQALNYVGFLPVLAGGALLVWLTYQVVWGD